MLRCYSILPLGILVLAVVAAPARGEVVNSAANGFRIKIESEMSDTPQQVYHIIVDRLGDWWSHSFSGDSKNLSIDAKEHGWWGEKLPDGGFVGHMQIVFLRPGKMIRFTGGLGPLQELGVNGALTIALTPAADQSTTLTLRYNVSGYDPNGLDKFAPSVNGVLAEQVANLKACVEKSEPAN